MFEGCLGTVFVDDVVAGRVHTCHIVPPFVSSALFLLSLQGVPKTLLSQVFIYDFVSSNLIIGWLHSAVLTATVAVAGNIAFVAMLALPEDVMRLKVDVLLSHFLFNLGKVLQEVKSTVG